MPRIRFFESDNTGSSPVSDFAGVFVPGDAPFVTGENGLAKPDSNNCIYLPSTTTELNRYITESEYTENSPMSAYHMVEYLLSLGYGVVYKYMDGLTHDTANKEITYYIPVTGVTSTNFGSYELYQLHDTVFELATEFVKTQVYFVQYKRSVNTLSNYDWSFLNDKNAYPIKFITAGPFKSIHLTFLLSIPSKRLLRTEKIAQSLSTLTTQVLQQSLLVAVTNL